MKIHFFYYSTTSGQVENKKLGLLNGSVCLFCTK